jgi:hypothetical protein
MCPTSTPRVQRTTPIIGVDEPLKQALGSPPDEAPLPVREHDHSLVLAPWAVLREQAGSVAPLTIPGYLASRKILSL